MKKFFGLLTLAFCTLAGFGAFIKRNVVEPMKAERERLGSSATIEFKKAGSKELGANTDPVAAALVALEGAAESAGGEGVGPKLTLESIEFPSVASLASEASADPHATPASLIGFAEAFAEHMSRALSDWSYAPKVMTYLEHCAGGMDGKAPAAIRVYCVKNGERLEGRYPERFHGRAAQMSQRLPAELKTLARAL